MSRGQSLLEIYSLPAADIERQSFQIIEGLLSPLTVSAAERHVLRRIVHASGDPELARRVRFHPQAVDAALIALRQGRTIFTDVRMVAAGINSPLAASLGCPVHCALDLIGEKEKPTGAITRTALALNRLGHQLDGSLIAIGNSPTALLALLDMIDNGQAAPAVIIGMPVGFVAAAEAKQELTKRDIPYITIQGTRGGSGVTAATVNALMLLAREGPKGGERA